MGQSQAQALPSEKRHRLSVLILSVHRVYVFSKDPEPGWVSTECYLQNVWNVVGSRWFLYLKFGFQKVIEVFTGVVLVQIFIRVELLIYSFHLCLLGLLLVFVMYFLNLIWVGMQHVLVVNNYLFIVNVYLRSVARDLYVGILAPEILDLVIQGVVVLGYWQLRQDDVLLKFLKVVNVFPLGV